MPMPRATPLRSGVTPKFGSGWCSGGPSSGAPRSGLCPLPPMAAMRGCWWSSFLVRGKGRGVCFPLGRGGASAFLFPERDRGLVLFVGAFLPRFVVLLPFFVGVPPSAFFLFPKVFFFFLEGGSGVVVLAALIPWWPSVVLKGRFVQEKKKEIVRFF